MFFHSQRNISHVHLKHTWTPLSRNIWPASVFIMPIRIWWTRICLYCKLLWTTVFRMHGPSPVLFTAIMAKHLSNTEKTVKTPICPIKKEPIWELMVFCKPKIKPFQISILFQKYCWSGFLISIGLLKCVFIPASRHFRISSWYELAVNAIIGISEDALYDILRTIIRCSPQSFGTLWNRRLKWSL